MIYHKINKVLESRQLPCFPVFRSHREVQLSLSILGYPSLLVALGVQETQATPNKKV